MQYLQPILVSFVLLCFMTEVLSRPRQKNQHHGLLNLDDRVIAFTDNVWDENIPRQQSKYTAKSDNQDIPVQTSKEKSEPDTGSESKNSSPELKDSSEYENSKIDDSYDKDSEEEYYDDDDDDDDDDSYSNEYDDDDGDDDKEDDNSQSDEDISNEQESNAEEDDKIVSDDDDSDESVDEEDEDDDISDEKKKLVQQYIKEIYGGELPYGDDPNAYKEEKKGDKSYKGKANIKSKKQKSENLKPKDKSEKDEDRLSKNYNKMMSKKENKHKRKLKKETEKKGYKKKDNKIKGLKDDKKPLSQAEKDKMKMRNPLSQAEKDKQKMRKPLSQAEKDKEKKVEPLSQSEKDKNKEFKFHFSETDKKKKTELGKPLTQAEKDRTEKFGAEKDKNEKFGAEKDKNEKFGAEKDKNEKFGGDKNEKFGGDKNEKFGAEKDKNEKFGRDKNEKFGGDKNENFGGDKNEKFGAEKDKNEKFGGDKNEKFGAKKDKNEKFGNPQGEKDKSKKFGDPLSQSGKDKARNLGKPLTQAEKDKAKKFQKPLSQGEKDKMKMFKTPYEVKTSPNPPTTKPSKVTPVDRKHGVKEYIQSKPYQSCSGDGDCPSGRVCHDRSFCVCGDDQWCSGHNKEVCDDDGELYTSHCELHRTACVKGKRIKVDHTNSCLKKKETPSFSGHKSKKRQGVGNRVQAQNCQYEAIMKAGSTTYLVCDSFTTREANFDKCRATCDKCVAFTFDEDTRVCEVFSDEGCTSMLLNQRIRHYLRQCSAIVEGNCNYMEVDPALSSGMCGTASTNNMTSIEDCHRACNRSQCKAFKYDIDDGSCDLYLDQSCIAMLEKSKANYYVRRCTTSNGEKCSYSNADTHTRESCIGVSSSTETFEECRDACQANCLAFSYEYNSGSCSLYSDTSCIANLSVNFYNRKCPSASQQTFKFTDPNKQYKKEGKKGSRHNFKNEKKHKASVAKDKNLNKKEDKSLSKKEDKSWNKKENKNWNKNEDNNWNKNEKNWNKKEKDQDNKNLKRLNQDKNEKKSYKDKKKIDDDKDVPGFKNKKFHWDKSFKQNDAMMADGPREQEDESDDYTPVCNKDEFNRFKGSLVRYHCVRFGLKDCDMTVIPDSSYLVSLMFSYYDRNTDNVVEKSELFEIQSKEKFSEMFVTCKLLDLFKFDGANMDTITRSQFIKAFDISIEEKIMVVPTLATVGNGLEIQCGITPTAGSEIIWRRHSVDLMEISFPDIAVFSDGMLYFDSIGVHHTGNYTCHDRDKPGIKQVHILKVQMAPHVRLSPSSQMIRYNNMDVILHCHAEGIPLPKIQWEVNKKIIPNQINHFIRTHENGTLIIHNADYQQDTGAYKCLAKNMAGEAEDLATVFIRKPNESATGYSRITVDESFFIFHKHGYNVYNPQTCATQKLVKPEFGYLKYTPEELDAAPRLCPDDRLCSWGNAITVKDRYVYITQPEQNRVLVIDSAQTLYPVQFVETDKYPTKLHYVEHLDQVWVLCWNADKDTGSKTIVVIRDASKDERHHMVHTQPIGYRFDLVQDIFLPPSNDLRHNFNYGYVIHTGQRGLFKLELESMRYTKAVDLSAFDCVPDYLAYIPIGGQIVVKCIQRTHAGTRTIQILMDHITDTALANLTVEGTPYVTPDSRYLATVDEHTGRVVVAKVLENGEVKRDFEVTTGSAVSDVTFFPSDLSRGYDLVLASAEDGMLYVVSLTNGRVTVIKGVDDPRSEKAHPWSLTSRSITSGNYFSEYLASPSTSSFTIVNGKLKYIQCHYDHMDTPEAVAYSHAVSG